ncbi:MAG: PleD family two-component system response regulator [Betaproteobacteria bacterium]
MNIQKILIVDDSPTDRLFWAELLTRPGFAVSTADSAEEAELKLQASRPDLSLMDVVMPGRNGFQLTRQLARDPAMQSIPIIMCTSKNQPTDRIWGVRQGARDYVTKPVDAAELLGKSAARN